MAVALQKQRSTQTGRQKDEKKWGQQKPPVYRRFVQGGLAAMAGGAASHPLDVIKVLLQIQGEGSAVPGARKLGLFQMGQKVFFNDGVTGLFRGLTASLLRQGVYSSVRFGVYDSINDSFRRMNGDVSKELPLWEKVISGISAGAIGAAVGNPADVAMVRMQADGRLPPEQRRNYKNVFDGLSRIAREEGVLALWNGVVPTVARAMVVTASQFAAYDQIKETLLSTGIFRDNPSTHFTSGFLAGFVASCTSNPVDVIKTRIMNMKPGQYSGPIDCTIKTVRSEGPLALYKGFVPTFVRQAPFVIVTFVTLEQIKRFYRYLDSR
mmetsp:Transcript_29411/g.36343  ORF Transcript_29411/g.36343 Transcript_29411/m.36343 type:complete len:323 (-) Transcript_29411:614-1582(-)|eukprot:CAMPEP_0204840294 /NCGR_PEP_ID=MMETSP1346-20131115/37161_1 /ASSEMBLY_ACC=CAM_ASM_000771 /TAXON_ID=215587 /ORGANISM="Aplanochytrium stocchinoi, Strain GSBS06" /LENGTH=322 /DNA_ID=CAMNT_0051977585 /DNA_START=70 /DNA_END=1038 /DNA_ORIENTATION=+